MNVSIYFVRVMTYAIITSQVQCSIVIKIEQCRNESKISCDVLLLYGYTAMDNQLRGWDTWHDDKAELLKGIVRIHRDLSIVLNLNQLKNCYNNLDV